jgi:hypothetical protein
VTPEEHVREVVRSYLSEADQNVEFQGLRPAIKQQAVELTEAVIRGQLVSSQSRAWYSFGFATAKDHEQERHKGGLYQDSLMNKTMTRQEKFAELHTALVTNQLVGLFESNSYAPFSEYSPVIGKFLGDFLNTPTASGQLLTIWLLVHYLKMVTPTEPLAALKRDYGFHLPKNHGELLLWKAMYG